MMGPDKFRKGYVALYDRVEVGTSPEVEASLRTHRPASLKSKKK